MIGRTVARRLATRAASRVARVRRDGESGFILLESIIAIALITVIMSAVGAEYVSGLVSTNHARLQSVAVEVAGSNLDQIQALHPSDLVTGRGSAAVDAERTTVANFTSVGGTALEAYDSSASSSSTGTTFVTTATTTTVGPATYSIYRYFECTSAATSGSCVSTPSQSSLTANNIRAIVVVTWPQRGCASVTTPTTSGPTCSYSTSSIINADDDLTFDLNQPLPAAPVVGSTSSLTVAVNDAVSYQMTIQSGTGVAPYTWSITSGALPSGLTMSTTGLITGTVSGTSTTNTSTITTTDAFLRTASATITWTVEPPLTIAQLANQSNTVGAVVTKTLSASGGGGSGYTFSDPNSTLPPGLTISSTGVITGSLTKSPGTAYPATYPVSITATDPQACPACANSPRTTTMNFQWTVAPAPLVISNLGTQGWTVNTPLASTLSIAGVPLSASGGDGVYVWSATGLPAGVIVNPATGLLAGIPLSTGSGTATVSAIDVLNGQTLSATMTFPWTVYPRPTITTPANQTNSIGGTVNLAVASTCANAPCTYTATGLPTGLVMNSITGVISGTVGGSAGSYLLANVQVVDAGGALAVSGLFTWNIVNAPTITNLGPQSFTETGVESVPVSYTCPIASCTLSLSGSMPGLGLTTSSTTTANLTSSTSLTVSNGSGTVYVGGTVQNTAVSGTATSATYNPIVTITTSDAAAASSAMTTWTAYVVPTVTSPGAEVTARYAAVSINLATTCADAPCVYTLNGGPAGLSINSSGVITGTVTSSAQTFSPVSVTVTDSDGVTATTSNFNWTVSATTNNLATLFNNVAVTADNNTSPGNFDGANGTTSTGDSFSATALQSASPNPLTAGATTNFSGLQFTWPASAGTGQPDNVLANGQTVTITGNGSTLGFLLSSDYGASSGSGTITYTDGTTQSYTISSPDWWGAKVAASVANSSYYNQPNNAQSTQSVNVYYAGVSLNAAKTVASVTLPTISSKVAPNVTAMHVFAMSLTSAGLSSAFNNVGVTTPLSTQSAGFDANNNTYSQTALTAAGAKAGSTLTSNGITFTWPSSAGTGSADNVLSSGQTIAPSSTLGGTTLGFLLASNGGTTTGTGTITYTDGTTQSFTLGAPAWNSGTTTSAALTTSTYDGRILGVNTSLLGTRYVYYQGVSLASGKTIATVQLPNISTSTSSNSLHVFAMGAK